MHQFWYNVVKEVGGRQPALGVRFYRTTVGNEPVREWLCNLTAADRRAVGYDIETAQYGWPLGMPLIRKLEPGLWEVRCALERGIARVMFTVEGSTMVLLHGFVKKSRKTPVDELHLARRRLTDLREGRKS